MGSMSERFMRMAKNKLEWCFVVRNPNITLRPKFIEEIPRMDWDGLIEYQPLPMWFIEKYEHKVDPQYLPGRYLWWKGIKNENIRKMLSFIKSKRKKP